jgi:hypothetical protein
MDEIPSIGVVEDQKTKKRERIVAKINAGVVSIYGQVGEKLKELSKKHNEMINTALNKENILSEAAKDYNSLNKNPSVASLAAEEKNVKYAKVQLIIYETASKAIDFVVIGGTKLLNDVDPKIITEAQNQIKKIGKDTRSTFKLPELKAGGSRFDYLVACQTKVYESLGLLLMQGPAEIQKVWDIPYQQRDLSKLQKVHGREQDGQGLDSGDKLVKDTKEDIEI